MKKIRLIWTDESVNSNGFWVKSSGIDMTRFNKNPIMLYNHHRSYRGDVNEMLPIGRWENIELNQDGTITAEAVFDKKDAFANKIAQKVEEGFITACSIGIRVLEWSDKEEDIKIGQSVETAVKSELLEVSIVDIPSNANASGIVLYDKEDNVINLKEENKEFKKLNLEFKKMEKINLQLGLPSSSKTEEVVQSIAKLQEEVKTEKSAREKAEKELKELKDSLVEAQKKEAEEIVEQALKVGKITAGAKEYYLKLFALDFEATKGVLNTLPSKQSLAERAGAVNTSNSICTLSWDELDKQGKLAELKEKYPDVYNQKYEEMVSKLNIKG